MLSGDQSVTVPASRLTGRLQVRGRYNGWDLDAATFGVFEYAFTGAPNPLDITGGKRIVAFASKVPDHRGLVLSGPLSVDIDGENLEISRAGTGVSMKLQAKDCAQGGVFQMEPERSDGTATRIRHTLGAGTFYVDNPNFRHDGGGPVEGQLRQRRLVAVRRP